MSEVIKKIILVVYNALDRNNFIDKRTARQQAIWKERYLHFWDYVISKKIVIFLDKKLKFHFLHIFIFIFVWLLPEGEKKA